MPMLIIFGGLPGTGKTTIAQQLARELGAVYLRIDSMEQASDFYDLLIEEALIGNCWREATCSQYQGTRLAISPEWSSSASWLDFCGAGGLPRGRCGERE